MYNGDVQGVTKILEDVVSEISKTHSQGASSFSFAEAAEIINFVYEREKYHDKNIDLSEKITNADKYTIPGENTKKYNILVVEDISWNLDDRTAGRLGKKVLAELTKTGKYCGTSIYATISLAECMHICGTGQIDAIVMDGGADPWKELNKSLEGTDISISVKQNDVELDVSQISSYKEKNSWQERIFSAIKYNGHALPPCAIFPKGILNKDLGKYIDLVMLKQQHPLYKVLELTQEENEKEMINARALELAGQDALAHYLGTAAMNIPEITRRNEMERDYIIDKQISHSKGISMLGKKLSANEFDFMMYDLVAQQLGSNMEKMRPTEVMRGLQTIELACITNPEHASNRESLRELDAKLGEIISLSAAQMEDTSFFIHNNMDVYVNLVSNVSLIIEQLKTKEHYKLVVDEMQISRPWSDNSNNLVDFVEKNILYNILHTTAHYAGKDHMLTNPISSFLITQGKKLAAVVSKEKEFEERYQKIINPEKLTT